nr:DUF6691 family protein [Aliikangiella sp. G2MR2-5]
MYEFQHIGDGIHLIFALIIGLAFGATLEQSGLGNPKKLTGQFLLHDMTVFKVMFTAIITAMTALFYLHYLGWIELSIIRFTASFPAPQFIGGLILGVGFMISGYCPGTAFIGAASGHKDGWFTIVGLFIGSFVFATSYTWLESFYSSRSPLPEFLYQFSMLTYGMTILIICSLALLCFFVVEKIENHFSLSRSELCKTEP